MTVGKPPNWNSRHRQADAGTGQAGDYEPPFSPPPKYEPNAYPQPNANPFPFEIPPPTPAVQPATPTPAIPQPNASPLSLLVAVLGGMLSSGGMTNLLLIVLAGLAVVRTFRKAAGQTLLLDDNTWQALVDTIKSLATPKSNA